MHLKSAFSVSAVTLLTACGGGTSVPLDLVDIDDVRVAKSFADNSGIVRSKSTVDGVTTTNAIFAPDYRTYNAETGVLPVDVNADGVELISTNDGFTQYGEYTRVNYRYNGSTNNLLVYVNNAEDVAAVIYEGSLAHGVAASGQELISVPNGSFTYRGDVFTKSRGETGVEQGSFTMNANFASRTATIEAQTATTQLSGTDLSIGSNGAISGTNLTMTVLGQTSTTAGLEGNFHGQSAVGVSGVYYNNANNPTHIGTFAGTR